jgi:hypothetical protein
MSGMTAQHELNQCLIQWQQSVMEQQDVNMAAAKAEAEYRTLKAKALTTAKFEDPKISLGLAEALAESKQDVADALTNRLITAARADSLRSRLQWFRARADSYRSEIATDRAASALYAGSGGTT